ncbi:MAG TPA: tungsten ABC transporter substrate-binding protein [Chloroflexi bacterium]|jgi:tungstate transport system substrate-binding protein|nr:tungsten ABC transporter substrate-binding protein [Chloroflexota bacterium]HAL27509.1 tungsten ABC transporter substrate-binding protein [Chloroflexota bacterium]
MRRFLSVVCSAIVLAACAAAQPTAVATTQGAPSASPSPARPDLLLATTTSTQDSGLLDVLIPDFEKKTGYKVKTSAVGTGAALAIGARGDADVVLVHAPSLEQDFMKQGNGDRRLFVMHNDFIVVGPPADPAGITGKGALDALRAIAAAQAMFISRGDNSGTDVLEKSLWKQAGITPAKPWYVEAATGMGQTLQIASEKRAYTITDRSTYVARKASLDLGIVVDKDPPLLNYYHVITVSPTKFPKVNSAGANAFADYLVNADTQKLIASFGVDKFGQQLFFPDAGQPDPSG